MTNLIYQYYRRVDSKNKPDQIMDDDNDYFKLSEKSISKYAETCNAEYRFLSHKLHNNLPPFYGIFSPFIDRWCYDYDNICFIDSDIMATVGAKNIFEIASNDCISIMFMDTACRWKSVRNVPEIFKENGHGNSGVVVFPKCLYDGLVEYSKNIEQLHLKMTPIEKKMGSFDQALINTYIAKQNEYFELGSYFNYHLTRLPRERRFEAGLIHYHRKLKDMMPTEFNDERILK